MPYLSKTYNFRLKKMEFLNGLDLRYGRELTKTPSTCHCGETLNITHALHCAKLWYIHVRHNEIRYTFVSLMNETCYDAKIEPEPQSIQGESFYTKTQALMTTLESTPRRMESENHNPLRRFSMPKFSAFSIFMFENH